MTYRQPEPPDRPPVPGGQKVLIALGIYAAVGAMVAISAKFTALDVNREDSNGAYILLGPLSFLFDAIASEASGIFLTFFVIGSLVALTPLLSAVAMKSGCVRGVFLAGAIAIWIVCGLVDTVLHARW